MHMQMFLKVEYSCIIISQVVLVWPIKKHCIIYDNQEYAIKLFSKLDLNPWPAFPPSKVQKEDFYGTRSAIKIQDQFENNTRVYHITPSENIYFHCALKTE